MLQEAVLPAREDARQNALGLTACTALVVGNMIGSGIFLLPASLAAFGPISLAGWVLTSLGALVLAVIFGRLSRLVMKTGGPYAYTEAGYGDFAGFIIAWGYWIARGPETPALRSRWPATSAFWSQPSRFRPLSAWLWPSLPSGYSRWSMSAASPRQVLSRSSPPC